MAWLEYGADPMVPLLLPNLIVYVVMLNNHTMGIDGLLPFPRCIHKVFRCSMILINISVTT